MEKSKAIEEDFQAIFDASPTYERLDIMIACMVAERIQHEKAAKELQVKIDFLNRMQIAINEYMSKRIG